MREREIVRSKEREIWEEIRERAREIVRAREREDDDYDNDDDGDIDEYCYDEEERIDKVRDVEREYQKFYILDEILPGLGNIILSSDILRHNKRVAFKKAKKHWANGNYDGKIYEDWECITDPKCYEVMKRLRNIGRKQI